MAVPLTSDLPGTSKEAGGDIQVRPLAWPPRLVAGPQFQVTDTRKPCQKTFVRVDVKVETISPVLCGVLDNRDRTAKTGTSFRTASERLDHSFHSVRDPWSRDILPARWTCSWNCSSLFNSSFVWWKTVRARTRGPLILALRWSSGPGDFNARCGSNEREARDIVRDFFAVS